MTSDQIREAAAIADSVRRKGFHTQVTLEGDGWLVEVSGFGHTLRRRLSFDRSGKLAGAICALTTELELYREGITGAPEGSIQEFQYVPHADVDDFKKAGWLVSNDMLGAHHGHYSVLMKKGHVDG